jgi:ribosomal protein S19
MGDMSLIDAVKADDYAIVEALIKGGADVNQQDEQGWTRSRCIITRMSSSTMSVRTGKSFAPILWSSRSQTILTCPL